MPDKLEPKDKNEAIAIFRSELIGALTRQELSRGELRTALVQLSKMRVRPPGAERTRTFSVPTLERLYYRYKKHGLAGLAPRARKDKGRAKRLSAEQQALLCDIRREHPNASASLILRTLTADGRLDKGTISASALRRFFVLQRLDRRSRHTVGEQRVRLRWQAERPDAIWHGAVCHGPTLLCGERKVPMRIHGLLDDASRYVVALVALEREREVDMLDIFVSAMRRHGAPSALYLDNGATYRGDILRTACARLDISLLHAKPYDPEARGKMERFWRTLREGCLDFCGHLASLDDINARLQAYLAEHYHCSPHGSLMGKSPEQIYLSKDTAADSLDEKKIKEALTVRSRRRVRRDSTLSVDGVDYELSLGFLAGSVVTVGRAFSEPNLDPWVEHDGKKYPLHQVDPLKNAHRKREARRDLAASAPPRDFDPAGALLAQSVAGLEDDGAF